MRTQRTAVTTALLAVMLMGCGAGGPAVPEEATGTLEQLAEKARCAPDIRTDAAELRQAACATDDGKYALLTFATDRGQREWINQAKDYGGSYLVGRRWVVAGDERTVTAVRGRLGGAVETAAPHQPHASPSGEGGHSGHH